MGMRLRGHSDCMRANRVQLAAQAAARCPDDPYADASSPHTRWARLGLHSSRAGNHPNSTAVAVYTLDGDAVASTKRLHGSKPRTALAAQAAARCPGQSHADASSPHTRWARLGLHSSRAGNHPHSIAVAVYTLDGDAVAWT